MQEQTRNNNISIARKLSAVLVALFLLLATLFAVFFVAAESTHHCTHDDCPICAGIDQCEQFLHHISDGIVAVMALIWLTVIARSVILRIMPDMLHGTLVSRKIRLND